MNMTAKRSFGFRFVRSMRFCSRSRNNTRFGSPVNASWTASCARRSSARRSASGSSGVTNLGHQLIACTNQAFQYDLDGNLTNDALWGYEWDGENRLVRMQSRTEAPAEAKRKLEFSYD